MAVPWTVATARADAYQHVENGGFENGLQRWSVSPGAVADVTHDAAEGDAAARFELGEAVLTVRQRLDAALAPGTYHLSLYARSPSPAQVFARVDLDVGGGHVEVSGDAMSGWVRVEGDVAVETASAATLTVGGRGGAGDVIELDDVRLEGPPPVVITPTPTRTSTATATPLANETPSDATPAPPSPTASPAPVAIGSDLRNGGFEDLDSAGALAAWGHYGGSLGAATSPVHGGTRAARLESTTGATKWLHQPVRVEPGGTYAFDAWVLHDDPNVASAFLRVSWYASDDASGSAIGTTDSLTRLDAPAPGYRELTTGPVTAPQDARSARLRVMLAPSGAARAAIYVDDAEFGPAAPLPPAEATPAPVVALPNAEPEPSARHGSASARQPQQQHATSAQPGALPAENARIVINEVLYDPHGRDQAAGGEWVELYNAGSEAVSLAGWRLDDGEASTALPELLVLPGGFALVAASDSFSMAHPSYTGALAVVGRIGNGLGNDGDALRLYDPAGAEHDAISWGDDDTALSPPVGTVAAGHSIERQPAGVDTGAAEDFVDNGLPSPGRGLPARSGSDAPRTTTPRVETLPSPGRVDLDWLPWAAAAASGAAFAAAAGWRAFGVVRARGRGA